MVQILPNARTRTYGSLLRYASSSAQESRVAIPGHPLAAYCRPENKVSLGFVARLNNKIRVIQRRAYGLRDEDYLRLKVLTCTLPAL